MCYKTLMINEVVILIKEFYQMITQSNREIPRWLSCISNRKCLNWYMVGMLTNVEICHFSGFLFSSSVFKQMIIKVTKFNTAVIFKMVAILRWYFIWIQVFYYFVKKKVDNFTRWLSFSIWLLFPRWLPYNRECLNCYSTGSGYAIHAVW